MTTLTSASSIYTIWMARQGYIRSVPAGRGGIAVVKALYVNLVETRHCAEEDLRHEIGVFCLSHAGSNIVRTSSVLEFPEKFVRKVSARAGRSSL